MYFQLSGWRHVFILRIQQWCAVTAEQCQCNIVHGLTLLQCGIVHPVLASVNINLQITNNKTTTNRYEWI